MFIFLSGPSFSKPARPLALLSFLSMILLEKPLENTLWNKVSLRNVVWLIVFLQCSLRAVLSAELTVCVCDSSTRVRNVLADTKTTGDRVKHIILVHENDELAALRSEAEAHNIQLHTFDEVVVSWRFCFCLTDLRLKLEMMNSSVYFEHTCLNCRSHPANILVFRRWERKGLSQRNSLRQTTSIWYATPAELPVRSVRCSLFFYNRIK